MKQGYFFTVFKAGRWRLSFAAALSATSGSLLTNPVPNCRTAELFCGATLFTLAVTWFNQIQERQEDSRMRRTMNRPLANNTLPLHYAVVWAVLCLAASLALIFDCGGWLGIVVLGAVTLLYNGFYTMLKRRSLFALIPGAIAGATPPILGSVCTGGTMLQTAPLTLSMFFFLWQVPHFWLAAERNSLDYESAGFPVPWSAFGNRNYIYMLALWITAFCVTLMALPAFGIVRSFAAQFAVIFTAAGLLSGLGCLAMDRPRLITHFVNLGIAAVCIVLVAEKMFGG